MVSLFHQPLHALLRDSADARKLSPLAEALIVRFARHLHAALVRASEDAVIEACALASNHQFGLAVLDLLIAYLHSSDDRSASPPGRGAKLLALLAGSGGALTAKSLARYLGVDRSTLEDWRAQRRALAFEREDRSIVYPVAQFTKVTRTRLRPPPHPAIAEILQIVGSVLTLEDVTAILATPHPQFSQRHGLPLTGFDALTTGDEGAVIAMFREIVGAAARNE
jgi:hypothetical protein